MGIRRGKPANEPSTDRNKPWDKLTPEQKGAEFDASDKDPRGYALRNFGEDPYSNLPGEGGKHSGGGKLKAKHRKP